jgi:UDP-N-acetylglucosamine--N-acetylmuramyl-(pentapeptide) pyrophosphoryl-undecaprenol N-acetylglucosamine transferase
LVPYEEHMPDLLARATLAVCRAGAGTIAELTVAGVPAVLVPLPGSPSDHQMRNAQTLERAGAGVVVRDEECDAARLDGVVTGLLADRPRLEQMSIAAKGLGRADATARVADLVEECARA